MRDEWIISSFTITVKLWVRHKMRYARDRMRARWSFKIQNNGVSIHKTASLGCVKYCICSRYCTAATHTHTHIHTYFYSTHQSTVLPHPVTSQQHFGYVMYVPTPPIVVSEKGGSQCRVRASIWGAHFFATTVQYHMWLVLKRFIHSGSMLWKGTIAIRVAK